MLTVMHISASGDEYVFQAATVLKCRDREATAIKFMVEFHDDRGQPIYPSIFDGAVYVMNELGKTVAKYDLGGWVAPEGTPLMPPPVLSTGVK